MFNNGGGNKDSFCKLYHNGSITGSIDDAGNFINVKIKQKDSHSRKYSSYKITGNIKNNLNLIKQDNDNWELESAKIFAKKKKLLEKNESYEKKLAKMARAGFSYDICKKILS